MTYGGLSRGSRVLARLSKLFLKEEAVFLAFKGQVTLVTPISCCGLFSFAQK